MLETIKKFWAPPVFDDDEETRIASHIYLLAKISLVVQFLLILIFIFLNGLFSVTVLILVLLLPIPFLQIYLVRKAYVRFAGAVHTILFWAMVNYTTLNTGGVRAVGFAGNLVVLTAAAMLINLPAVFVFGGATIVLGLVLAVLQIRGILPPISERVSGISSWVTQSALLIYNAGFLYIALANIRAAFQRTRRAEKEVNKLNKDLIAAYDTTLEGWAKALELKDKETEGHSRRVTDMTRLLAQKLGIEDEQIRQVYYGALLHDIGKMGIPDEVLNKPGPLTPTERLIVEQHPVIAYDLLKQIGYLQQALDIPYSHHEKWDGTGYPNGLIGANIPLLARIFAVVDVWDALTSDRPYRKAWTREEVVAYIKKESGQHFDPHIVEVFFTEVIKNK